MSAPSESELRLLRHLWHSGRQSAREIHDGCSKNSDVSFSTTRKLLDRMVDKNLVEISIVHGVKTFTPKQSKVVTLAGLIKHFATAVLNTEAPLPAAAFAGSKDLKPEEISELEQMLEDMSEEEAK